MVFHFSLSDSKFPQISRTLLSIPANLNNAIICVASTCPLISISSNLFTDPLEIIPSAPITMASLLSCAIFLVLWQGLGTYLYFLFLLFLLCFPSGSLGLVVWPRSEDLFVSHSPGQILGSAYTTCSYGQISISYTIPSGSTNPFSRV